MENNGSLFGKFDAMKAQERVLLVAVVAAMLYFVAENVVFARQRAAIQMVRASDATHVQQIGDINNKIAVLEQQAVADQRKAEDDKAKIVELQARIAEAASFLGEQGQMDAKLGELVRKLMTDNPSVTLVGLKTLPSEVFFTPPAPDPKAKPLPADAKPTFTKTIYKQGVEVSVRGSYLALLAYMEDVQRYPNRIYWHDARFDQPNYPDGILKVMLYSLSDRADAPLR